MIYWGTSNSNLPSIPIGNGSATAVYYGYIKVWPSSSTGWPDFDYDYSDRFYYLSTDGNLVYPYPTYGWYSGSAGMRVTSNNNTYDTCGTVQFSNNATSCSAQAYKNKTTLYAITIPNTVTSIMMDAFYGCTSLAIVKLPEGLTTIGSYVFYNCSALTDIQLPSTLTGSIDERTFYGCTSLQTINIPSGITTIGYMAFYGCTSLNGITIPSNIRTIQESAFENCSNFNHITFENGVTSIGNYAFYNTVPSGTTVEAPSSLNSLSASSFPACKLKFSNHTAVPTLTSKYDNLAHYYVPDNLYNNWIAASNWSDLYSWGYIHPLSDYQS